MLTYLDVAAARYQLPVVSREDGQLLGCRSEGYLYRGWYVQAPLRFRVKGGQADTAGMYALRERRQYVGQEDFEMAVAKVLKKNAEGNTSVNKLFS